MSDYVRCHFIPDTGEQCELWFLPDVPNQTHCPVHLHAASMQVNKDSYIEALNGQRKICAAMTIDELEIHIAGIETLIENQRANLLTARATKRDKLDELDEDERKERRKIQLTVNAEGQMKVEKVPYSPKNPRNRTSMKKDPIEHLMKTGLTREQAIAIMEA